MIEVEVRGDLEYAIRQLKKKLQIDGIKRELKRREYYEKPSVKKRRKEAEDARAKAEKEAEQARIQHENCAKARNNLSTLQNTPRVYTTNGAGQRTYMDDSARANALANSQKAVSEYCK
jgi:small subunit ribosomal protein S21